MALLKKADWNAVVFTGTYKRSLDNKHRILLPKRLRTGLSETGEEVSKGKDITLYLTPGTDHCLELHTTHSLNELALRASQSSAGSKNIRSFSRLFYARAQQCDIDKQGRIRIPVELAQLADLEKELVFVGVGFHWEIWDLDRWESYLGENDSAFDQIADLTFDTLQPAETVSQQENPNGSNSKTRQANSISKPK